MNENENTQLEMAEGGEPQEGNTAAQAAPDDSILSDLAYNDLENDLLGGEQAKQGDQTNTPTKEAAPPAQSQAIPIEQVQELIRVAVGGAIEQMRAQMAQAPAQQAQPQAQPNVQALPIPDIGAMLQPLLESEFEVEKGAGNAIQLLHKSQQALAQEIAALKAEAAKLAEATATASSFADAQQAQTQRRIVAQTEASFAHANAVLAQHGVTGISREEMDHAVLRMATAFVESGEVDVSAGVPKDFVARCILADPKLSKRIHAALQSAKAARQAGDLKGALRAPSGGGQKGTPRGVDDAIIRDLGVL